MLAFVFSGHAPLIFFAQCPSIAVRLDLYQIIAILAQEDVTPSVCVQPGRQMTGDIVPRCQDGATGSRPLLALQVALLVTVLCHHLALHELVEGVTNS